MADTIEIDVYMFPTMAECFNIVNVCPIYYKRSWEGWSINRFIAKTPG